MSTVRVNGREHEVSFDRQRSLLYVLREELGIRGPKFGCGEGECGLCTVLVDGEAVAACKTDIQQVAGKSVVTIEGIAPGADLHPVQQAFLELGAMQCGFCTPGMVTAAVALLARDPDPDEARIRSFLQPHLCRCGGYGRIVQAVRRASELVRAGAAGEAPAPAPRADSADLPTQPAPWDRQPPERRRFFDTLGDGLVAVVPPTPGGRGLPKGGAWVHVAVSGAVTAFSGKVELGQGVRAGLTSMVADELGVPPRRVRLVLSDTDLSPWDIGTFGSRSTPDSGWDLRRAAAALRGAIERLAAGKHGDASDWSGLLAGKREIVTVSDDVQPRPAAQWAVAGKDAPNPQALAIVTGRKVFPSDVHRPGMLHGAVLRPPVVGAVCERLDVAKALALPNVTIVQEAGLVAAVAPTIPAARAAVAAISAEWSSPPFPREAEIAAYLRAHPSDEPSWGICHHDVGDVRNAHAGAPVQLDAVYTTAYIAHVPIENPVAVAEWRGERVTVWVGTQRPFGVREQLAEALALPEEKIHVIVPDTGTGFGGKQGFQAAYEAALLARATGKAVRVAWSREEEFTLGHLRPAAVIDVRSGADADGTLRSWELLDCNAGAAALLTPYDVPNQSIHYRGAASPWRQGPYRSLAAVANNFARESHMDELAARTGADPLELRLRHLRDERLAAVLRASAERAGWAHWSRSSGRGLGIACGTDKGSRVATCAEVRVGADGAVAVERIVSAFECGAIVNPDAVRAQVEGCAVMGLGGALFEAVHFEDGRLTNARLSSYRLPRFSDLPLIEVVLLDRKDQPSVGAGETPIIAIAPALANAIFQASGRRLRSLPLVPDGTVS